MSLSGGRETGRSGGEGMSRMTAWSIYASSRCKKWGVEDASQYQGTFNSRWSGVGHGALEGLSEIELV